MAMEVSELAERQAKLEGENKQIDQRVSNAEQNQRDLRIQMDDKFEILLTRTDNTFRALRQDIKDLSNQLRQDNKDLSNRTDNMFNQLRQDNKDLSNRTDNMFKQSQQNHKDLSNRMHKDFKWLIGAILGTGILLKIIDKVW